MKTKRLDRATIKAQRQEANMVEARSKLLPLQLNDYEKLGLDAEQVQQRLILGLTNDQKFDSSRSLISILRSNLLTLFNAVVGGAFLLLLLLGQWKDALFGFAVVSNVLIGIIQEFSSKRALDRLALLNAPFSRVLRAGQEVQVHVSEVVLDDLLVLRPGDQIPADAVVVSALGLAVDESLLTGESEPVEKRDTDDLFAGSGVIGGSALARVTKVGPETYGSRLTLEARRFSMVNSELRASLARIVKWITWALLPIMAIVTNGQMQAVGGWSHALETGSWVEAALGSIASIIAMIPQGLVLITSISFALAAVKLASWKVLVQELPAVEGLARVDVICFDKTGTLTEGDMVFNSAEGLGAASDSAGNWRGVLAHFGEDPAANATTRCLAGNFETDSSLVETHAIAFSSANKWSSFSFQSGDAARGTWVLGAPDVMFQNRQPHAAQALEICNEYANQGKRTLVLAKSDSAEPTQNQLPSNLVPVAVVTFREKVRADASQTIRFFDEQGVQVRIISGDNPKTVASVATEAGVKDIGEPVDARTLPQDIGELAILLETHKVFGRVTPDQKRNMVAALQSKGHVVAMTGDGVNDALALKHADLGIAMGSGAAVTKAVSRLILLDGKFSNLPGVVAEGRRVIANIERISRLFLTKTTWAMSLSVVFGLALWSFPFLPRQLSAIDGFTIGLPAFALALLPNSRRYLPGFLKRSLLFCVPAGLAVAGLVVALSMLVRDQPQWSQGEAQTAVSMLLSITGLWVLAALSRPFTKPKLAIFAAMVVGFIGVFTIPLSTDFFGFVALDLQHLALPLLLGALGVGIIELVQQVVSRVLLSSRR
ncbi:MAG: HAD-IC family P-type ATPase [Micrococcales bacterium]